MYTYICIYIYTYTHIYMHIHTHIYMYMYMYIYIYILWKRALTSRHKLPRNTLRITGQSGQLFSVSSLVVRAYWLEHASATCIYIFT